MRKNRFQIIALIVSITSSVLFSSCATLAGGSTYNAHVIINNSAVAQIIYKGEVKGYGSAQFPVKRSEANKFSVTIKEEGSQEETFNYNSRTFRVGAFACSILFWTGITTSGIPIPVGPITDLASGAVWKPDVNETGVTQESTKNFNYLLHYKYAKQDKATSNEEKKINLSSSSLIEIVYLKNGNVIKGIIIEQIPNTQIKIQTADGSCYVFKMDDIEKITKEQSS